MRRRESGFSMIELLMIGAIIAILSAIGIGAYINSLHRARQKKTVTDIRTIATAWEARATETNTYAIAGYTFPSTPITYEALLGALSPTYTQQVPRFDGWQRPLEFGYAVVGTEGTYAIRSAGRDGSYDATYTPGLTNDLDCDIVWADGQFLVYPDAMQNE